MCARGVADSSERLVLGVSGGRHPEAAMADDRPRLTIRRGDGWLGHKKGPDPCGPGPLVRV
jgi:hypothetical protein